MSRRSLVAVAAAAALLAPWTAPAESLTGRQVMELVDARDDGDKSTLDLTMVLIDKSGSQRKRTIRSLRMDKGEDTLNIMFFLDPADVKDTGFLTYDYDEYEKDDDQ
ncbi:MAG: outer membrane lipoprotein-sorting protein, partial [Myxococcota bacterium]|nr:outer membrane lipoprotein-sorting protein [Myxococcota bacterium]